MAKLTTHAVRQPVDLSRLSFHAGQIGALKTIDIVTVQAGDGFSADYVGSFRMSPLRRALCMDARLEFFTFYIPHRYTDGNFQQMLVEGAGGPTLMAYRYVGPGHETWHANFLATNPNNLGEVPAYMVNGYLKVFNNYFKSPDAPDYGSDPATWDNDRRQFGINCAHLKSYLTAPLPEGYTDTHGISAAGDVLDVRDLSRGEALLFQQQERHLFATRYRDIVDSLGGHAPIDTDQRPQLVQRTSMWTSGYDVNGSDQATLGQFSGRSQQAFQHTVPRFFCPEHGMMITVALVRLPHVHTNSMPYEVGCQELSYETMIHDPVMAGVGGSTDVSMATLYNGGNANAFSMAYQQHHRVAAPAHVDERYAATEGFPFIFEIPQDGTGDSVMIQPHDYDHVFQTDALAQWNIQCKSNAKCMRYLVTTRDALMSDD